MKSDVRREVALITGASAGIGSALAACFAKGGFDLVLVARSADKLQALAETLAAEHGVKVVVEPCDLSLNGAAGKLATRLRKRKILVDALVNNAGVLEQGAFTNIDKVQQLGMIQLNITSLTEMLTEFIPPMQERKRGRILNVASIAAFQPLPSLATYAATKAYVLSLSESLAEELRPDGITVTALCPGITATDMMEQAKDKNSRLQLPSFVIGDVTQVAQSGYEACMAGEVIRVPGGLNLMGSLMARATPKWVVRRVMGVMGRRTI